MGIYASGSAGSGQPMAAVVAKNVIARGGASPNYSDV